MGIQAVLFFLGGSFILRIVSGEYGGRFIKAPDGAATRPTAQNVREALFNIIAPQLRGAVFIDLFAGSGAMGIEALSRGARKAVFADRGHVCVRIIKENLSTLGIGYERALIFSADLAHKPAFNLLKSRIAGWGETAADIVYADPPYNYPELWGLPARIIDSAICAPDGKLVIEHRNKARLPFEASGYGIYSEKKYGDTCLSFYFGDGKQ